MRTFKKFILVAVIAMIPIPSGSFFYRTSLIIPGDAKGINPFWKVMQKELLF